MPYRPSTPLRAWRGPRRALLAALADGASSPALVDAHAVRVVAEFQAFARELHDLAVASLLRLAGADPRWHAALHGAVTDARRLDRANPTIETLAEDFARLGIAGLRRHLENAVPGWPEARGHVRSLIALRNAVAHGNARDRLAATNGGADATVAWIGQCLTSLDAIGAAMDVLAWEHLAGTYGREPW